MSAFSNKRDIRKRPAKGFPGSQSMQSFSPARRPFRFNQPSSPKRSQIKQRRPFQTGRNETMTESYQDHPYQKSPMLGHDLNQQTSGDHSMMSPGWGGEDYMRASADPFVNLRQACYSGTTKSQNVNLLESLALKPVMREEEDFQREKQAFGRTPELDLSQTKKITETFFPKKININLNDLNCEVAEEEADIQVHRMKESILPRNSITKNIMLYNEPNQEVSPFKNPLKTTTLGNRKASVRPPALKVEREEISYPSTTRHSNYKQPKRDKPKKSSKRTRERLISLFTQIRKEVRNQRLKRLIQEIRVKCLVLDRSPKIQPKKERSGSKQMFKTSMRSKAQHVRENSYASKSHS